MDRSHFEKGLASLHGRCVSQRDQIKSLRAEKDKLQKEFELQKALHALGGAPQAEASCGEVSSGDSTELRNKCAALQQDLEKSKKFTSTQNGCIIELNAKLSAAQERLKVAEEPVAAPATNGSQRADATALRTELEKKESRVLALEADVAKERKRNQEKDAKVQELMDQIAQANQREVPVLSKAHLAELQAEREKTADVTCRLEDANKVKQTLEQEITALESAKEEMDDEMLGLRDQLRQTQEGLAKAAEDLEWAENEKGDLEEDLLEIMRETGLSARDSFEQKKQRIAKLEQDLAEARELLDSYQVEQNDDANKYERLEERLDNTKAKLSEANGQKKSLQNRVASLSAAEKKLKLELAQLKEENRELQRTNKQQSTSKKDAGENSTANRELRDENDRLRKENRKTAEKVDKLKEETQELQAQLGDAQEKRTSAEKKISFLEKAMAKLQEDFRKLEGEKKEAGKRANAASYDMIKQKETVQRLSVRIEDLQGKIENLEWEKKDLAERLATVEAEPGDTSTSNARATPSKVASPPSPAIPKEEKKNSRQASLPPERGAETPKTGASTKAKKIDTMRATPSKAASPGEKRKRVHILKAENSDKDHATPFAKSSDSQHQRSKPLARVVKPTDIVDITTDATDDHAHVTPFKTVLATSSPGPSTPSTHTVTDDLSNESLVADDWREWVETGGVLKEWYPEENPVCKACR